MRPGTSTTLGSGTLGKVEALEDGTSLLTVCGIAVGGKFALGDVLGPFLQLKDAEDKGIDEAYDTTNSTVAWKHIKDFYTETEGLGIFGVKLYVMVVAMTQTLTLTATAATASGYKKAVDAAEGNIRLVGLTFTPDGTYVPAYTDQMENDLWSALAQVKLTAEAHRVAKMPYRAIVEGRNFQGDTSVLKNMRAAGTTPAVNRAMVVIGNDWEYGQGAATVKGKYASVGAALGRAAAIKVSRNIGRVKDGALLSIVTGGLSNAAKLNTLTSTQIDLLNDNGFVFPLKHVRKSGFYWNDDHMACESTDDYSQLTLGRVIDKVDVIVHTTNIEEILNDVQLDPATGKMDPTTVKHFEALLEDAINAQMGGSNQEVSGLKCYIDPDQNVITLSALTQLQKIVPRPVLRTINTTIEYAKSV